MDRRSLLKALFVVPVALMAPIRASKDLVRPLPRRVTFPPQKWNGLGDNLTVTWVHHSYWEREGGS